MLRAQQENELRLSDAEVRYWNLERSFNEERGRDARKAMQVRCPPLLLDTPDLLSSEYAEKPEFHTDRGAPTAPVAYRLVHRGMNMCGPDHNPWTLLPSTIPSLGGLFLPFRSRALLHALQGVVDLRYRLICRSRRDPGGRRRVLCLPEAWRGVQWVLHGIDDCEQSGKRDRE